MTNGFGPVYDNTAGKVDWLAADLPFQGTAELAGLFTCRGAATVEERTRPTTPFLHAGTPGRPQQMRAVVLLDAWIDRADLGAGAAIAGRAGC